MGGLGVDAAYASGGGCPGPQFGAAMSTVIVTGLPGVNLSGAIFCEGGSVTQSFGVINSLEASVPTSLVTALSSLPGLSVYPDLTVSVQSTVESSGPHTPSDAYIQETGADSLAAAGDTGHGVTVAVLDTGIDNLPDFQGRLVGGVDLTGENNPFQDDFGHGTFVAGLIAGNGASSGGQYSGEAPGANLVAIKVAGASGQTDLATVIQGAVWAITHKAQYNIGVLNMSLGFQPIGSTVLNPLDQAVEAAWNAGIAVVTSAGNGGPFNGTILSPGDDPLAITVGALDDMATPAITDDEMNDFSSVGPTSPDGWVKPDLVTSGRSVVSLAAPGSTISDSFPSAHVGSSDLVGSGTSFSAAITSGAAALVLADNPGLTPNQVKARLIGTVTPGPVGNPFVDGHGALDAQAAATSGDLEFHQSTFGILPTAIGATVSLSPLGTADTWNINLWSGSLSSTAWNSTAWNSTAWNSTAWNSTAWNGYAWDSTAWNGFAWTSTAWNSTAWNGAEWNSTAWNSTAWNSTAWNSTAWNSTAWNSTAWNSTAWNSTAWNSTAWNSTAWNGSSWS
ncbi:MAG TPA: S8 family serine peptidase [Acidimicrobiales bacterium]|nr:S8 family serine peptidase [Acidimicrobiales bacterium]